MNRVIQHTAYLTRRHDCVVLPGWGALIATRRSARLDSVSGMALPPSRVLSFNSMISFDDGLLATSVMRREGIGYNAAKALVSRDLDDMRRTLAETGRLEMERVGLFTIGEGGTVEFTPDSNSAANDACAMLHPVALPPTRQERIVQETRSHKRRKDTIYLPLSRNIFKFAASLMMLLSLGWMAYSTIEVSDEPVRASFAPAAPRVEAAAPVDLEPAAETVEPQADETAVQQVSAVRNDDSDSYCLVIASLGNRAELDKYMEQTTETLPLGVSRRGSRYRVYIATGATAAEVMALRAQEGIGDRYPDAWPTRL